MKTDTHPDRPASLYDNLRPGASLHGSGALSMGDLRTAGLPTMDRLKSPSQAHCLSTTVPQNIAAPAIAGRHTPTRNSLRHSRMIVLSRNGTVPRKYLPPILAHQRLAKGLTGLQLLVGAAVVTVSSWIYLYTPSLGLRDTPFWSGIPLFLSGLLGLILLCCCRKDYPGYPLSCCVFSYKMTSLAVSVVAGVACFCALVFAVLHVLSLQSMVCEPPLTLTAGCVCRSATEQRPYPDLSCVEVESLLSCLLLASAGVNCLGGILASWYLYLHWTSRYSYIYSQVRTNENRPMIISNKL